MVTIQPFTADYQQQVIDLISSIQQQEFGIAITIADQPDLLNIPTFYQKKKGNFWLALDQNHVVGTIALIDIGNAQAALRKMFVNQHYRGKSFGVAQRLLETLLNWSAEQHIHEVYLGTTDRFKAAHRFYEKNGFIKISAAQLPEAFPRIAVDTRFYYYSLSH